MATDKPAANESSALVHLLRDRADREPRQVALRVKRLGLWQETTWADLATRVRNLALGLATLGVKAGDAVAIIAAATPEAVALDLAIQALGGLALPIHPYTSLGDVRYLLDSAGVKVLLIGDLETADRLRTARELDSAPIETTVLIEGTAGLQSHAWRSITFSELDELGHAAGGTRSLDSLVEGRRADEPMSLHATAGTGGRPRLVRITSANLIAAWSEFLDGFGPSAQDSFVVEAPVSHVAGPTAPQPTFPSTRRQSTKRWPRSSPRCRSRCHNAGRRGQRRSAGPFNKVARSTGGLFGRAWARTRR